METQLFLANNKQQVKNGGNSHHTLKKAEKRAYKISYDFLSQCKRTRNGRRIVLLNNFGKFSLLHPGSTLHGYLSKILARSCQDLGKILAKIVTRYCQELQDAMVRSYQESHVSKKNLTKKPNMARKF